MLFFFPSVHPISLRMPRLQKYHMHAIEAKSLASFLLPMFLGSLTFLDAGIFWSLWCLKPCSQKQSCSFISHCFHTCCLDCPAIQTCRSMKLVLDWAVQTDADTSACTCRCIASPYVNWWEAKHYTSMPKEEGLGSVSLFHINMRNTVRFGLRFWDHFCGYCSEKAASKWNACRNPRYDL